MQKEKVKFSLKSFFMLCPVRHCIFLLSAVLLILYFSMRTSIEIMENVSLHFVRPWHSFFSRLCSHVSFSVCGVIIAVGVIAALVYIIVMIYRIVRCRDRLVLAYRLIFTAVTAFLAIYAGFCLLWGVYYYTSDFEAASGIKRELVSVEDLTATTAYFADICSEYSGKVPRDSQGHFAADTEIVFDDSAHIYDNLVDVFPCLAGNAIEAKPFMFSRIMSYINFTGFFFPFTGEANINVDSPACLVPSTIAHEIAHQRGVAQEDQANFAAVAACLESENEVYTYSGALLAYIHLGNALYKVDKDAYWDIRYGLEDTVQLDLSDNNEYWDRFDNTPVSTVSDTVYTGFLQSYGQELGLKTYGACVDLLVAYCKNMRLT